MDLGPLPLERTAWTFVAISPSLGTYSVTVCYRVLVWASVDLGMQALEWYMKQSSDIMSSLEFDVVQPLALEVEKGHMVCNKDEEKPEGTCLLWR